ncbi:MAG TPA: OmpA family protein [Polyangiaceae bacterium]|nr:OmpA family protein [Polyangiaceae bacterium]
MKISIIALVTSFLSVTACAATTPSPELVGARQSYDQARTDPNAKLVPDSVLSAKQALDKAESVHEKSPQSDEDRSFTYVAQRRAEQSLALGANAKAKQDQIASTARYGQLQDSLRTSAVAQLGVERNATNQLGTQLAQSQTGLAEANARTARAMESLAKIAQVKEEARGMVITLSGQVLFVTGKSELLPSAQDQLSAVAKALQDQGELRPIVVEGYTDSVGSQSNNMKLSRDRAEAVRSFLLSKGLRSDKVTAVGKGTSSPVASNDTADGRANNRRVEIVVAGASANGQ